MKKSIILLITLLFISTISLLILKNLNDSKEYLDNINYDYTYTQLVFTSSNIKQEIRLLIKNNKENLEDEFEDNPIIVFPPLQMKDISANITLKKLIDDDDEDDKVYSNINYLTNDKKRFDHNETIMESTSEYYKQMFNTANISDYYRFVTFFDNFRNEYKVDKNKILNYKQIQDIIDIYKEENDDSLISTISENFYPYEINKKTIKCNIDINLNEISIQEVFLLNLDTQEIKELEFIIKK